MSVVASIFLGILAGAGLFALARLLPGAWLALVLGALATGHLGAAALLRAWGCSRLGSLLGPLLVVPGLLLLCVGSPRLEGAEPDWLSDLIEPLPAWAAGTALVTGAGYTLAILLLCWPGGPG